MTVAEEIVAALSARSTAARTAPTRARCGGCGRPSATSTSWPPRRSPRPLMDAFTALPLVAEVIVAGTNEDLDPDHRRAPGGSAGGAAGVVGRGAAVLHRLEGAQHPDPGNRGTQGPQALRVRALPRSTTARWSRPRPRRRSTRSSGLPWIPPTLREDRGEVGRGAQGTLPDLVTEEDIRGDLHTHTDLTDGVVLAGGDGRRRPRPRATLLRRHRPRQEPADAADDRREDARPARAGAGARRSGAAG